MKNFSKIAALALALCMAVCMSVTSFAAEVTASGDSGSTPVKLSSTDDGTIGGDPSATKMSVTVPTAFPMAMSETGDVTTATDCKITNNSYGAVRVKSVTINAENGWSLAAFGDKSTLAAEKVDSKQIGFAMTIGGGAQVYTSASGTSTQTLISAPITGCYMTGVGDTDGNSVAIVYAAIVTPISEAITSATVASVVFVIEWDTAA